MRRAFLILCILSISASTCTYAQGPAGSKTQPPPITPLQVELMAPLDTARVTPETAIFAKVMTDWNDPGCMLHQGAVIEGHVTRLSRPTKDNKGSSITLAFDHADCDGQTRAVHFIVVAVIAVPWVDKIQTLMDTIAANEGYAKMDAATEGGGSITITQGGGISYGFSTTASGMPVSHPTFDPSNEKKPLPTHVKPGDVVGLKNVSLGMGTGLEGASVLTAMKGNIRLELSSQLVLVPKEAFTPGSESVAAANGWRPAPDASGSSPAGKPTATSAAPPVPEVDETSICKDPCTLVSENDEIKSSKASLTLPVSALGYKPFNHAGISLNSESALSYVGSNNLLFTYDPHLLRRRYPSGFTTETMRTIRAVLLDRGSLRVKRVVDWQVQGEGQYLWHVGADELLVHLGHSLRLLGPDLNVIREVPVPGLLDFVSTSPSGDHIAVGTVRELHTRETHARLYEAFHSEPDEGVDVQIFDQNLSLLFSLHQNIPLPAPVLSDAGEISVQYAGKGHWSIQEVRWDRTQHTIAKLISQCPVSISAPRSGSIFVVGCTTSVFDNWYRILRLDGHLILSSHGSGLQTEQCFSSQNGDFAVRVLIAKPGVERGHPISKNDLLEQKISIYRSRDGKPLFSIKNPAVSLSQQSFALSPGGDQLAVLTDTAISLYTVEKSAP